MSIRIPESHLLEHEFAKVITAQSIFGWEFDHSLAVSLYHELDNRMKEITETVRPHLTMELVHKWKPLMNIRVASGAYSKRALDWWGNEVALVEGPYTPIEWEEPDIGSRNKLMKQLTRHGWRHVNVTEKGNPKLDEESLEGLDLGETGNMLVEYFKAKQRKSTLLGDKGTGLLTKAYEYAPGRYKVDALANPCGTNTHRCTHSVVVNIPKADPSVYYGKQFRSLFTAPPGWVVFGADASQLEFRIALSYMNALELIKLVSDPEVDFHSVIWEEMKPYMTSRSTTKNIVYGSIYGATADKLGTMADHIPSNMSKKQVGQELMNVLLRYIPGLADFKSIVENRAKRGYIKGLDGSPVYIRKKEGRLLLHTTINTIFQQAGSMVVKRATVDFNKEVSKMELPWHQTVHQHDELQGITREAAAPLLGDIFNRSLVAAGNFYGLSCPMEGEWKMGKSWAETH